MYLSEQSNVSYNIPSITQVICPDLDKKITRRKNSTFYTKSKYHLVTKFVQII